MVTDVIIMVSFLIDILIKCVNKYILVQKTGGYFPICFLI